MKSSLFTLDSSYRCLNSHLVHIHFHTVSNNPVIHTISIVQIHIHTASTAQIHIKVLLLLTYLSSVKPHLINQGEDYTNPYKEICNQKTKSTILKQNVRDG